MNPRESFDGKEIAKKIISCINETRERFGGAYIVSMLTGAKEKRIIEYGHERLASYMSGKEFGKKEWQSFIRELCRLGFISIEGDKYPILKLNAKSHEILAGKLVVSLTKAAGMKEAESPVKTKMDNAAENYDKELFEILRIMRKSIADSENVPPYVIFHDTALMEMSVYYPQSLQSMARIKGVGSAKLEKYGIQFMEKIQGYCLQKGINEREIASKTETRANADECDKS